MTSLKVPLKKSIATVSLSGTLQEKMRAAAAIGFGGVEIFEHDLLNSPGTPTDVRRLAEDLGLEITLFQPFRDFEAMPPEILRRNLDRAERKFDVMEELGTRQILVCSNVQETALNDPARAAADLRSMAERAHTRGLTVGYEALAWGRHVNRWRQAWDIVREADHPALGLILDSFHTLAVGDTLDGLSESVPAGKLFFVQLADGPRKSMDVLSWSRHYRNFPGQGDLDVTGFTRAVLEAGYRGPLSLEVFNDEFRAASAYLIAHDGLRSLLWLEAEAGATTLPAPPTFHGFEFLEFAVEPGQAASLEARIHALGFQPAGTHRSKAVSLHRQGGVNLILNSEPDSHAAEFAQVHGPSVCAVALRVDDPERAMQRAQALLCTRWEDRSGPGEAYLPALRSPDGMLFYLLSPALADGLYQNDFDLRPTGGDAPAGIERIDHVAQALQPDQLGSFVLFYRTVFGLHPEAQHDLPDPYGLVSSRAMVSVGGTVSFPLNVSESGRTATGRFLSAFAGAGVHHIAFATPDLVGMLGRLDRDRAQLLSIPPNYFDDLEVRFPLSDEAMNTLRRARILYDQDGTGEYRQAFTDTFQDRFFFELVQRDRYAGFGAANAAVRMNAHRALRAGGEPG